MATTYKRREATPEQKSKAQERRDRFHKLVKQLAEMTEEERWQFTLRVGSVITCEGHALSPVNTSLVLMQSPTATVVGGFRQWIKNQRCVKKGEHGMSIWVPVFGKKGEAADTGESAEGDGPGERTGFVMGTVFDVSQTEVLKPKADGESPTPAETTAEVAAA